ELELGDERLRLDEEERRCHADELRGILHRERLMAAHERDVGVGHLSERQLVHGQLALVDEIEQQIVRPLEGAAAYGKGLLRGSIHALQYSAAMPQAASPRARGRCGSCRAGMRTPLSRSGARACGR